ncbi:MAG: YIP1 family protein [Paracoccaceae bacterium]
MTLIDSIWAQGMRAYREPRAAAADVLALGIPREALAPALFAVVALSAILNSVSDMLSPNPLIVMSPFQMAILSFVLITAYSFALAKIGNFLEGVGNFPDALLLIVLLQAMFLPLIALQLILFVLSPALAGLYVLVMLALVFWVQLNFIAALHGFTSLGRAFGVLLLAGVATLFALMFVAPLLVTQTGTLGNV